MNNGRRTLFDRFGLSAKKSNQPSDEKHYDEFLRVVEHFVDSVGRPISRDKIMASHDSFSKLDGYIRALRNQGMIESSADDPNKFELTPQGRHWVQSLFPPSKFKTRQWKKFKAKDEKQFADSKPDSRKPSNGKPKKHEPPDKDAQGPTDIVPNDMSSKGGPNVPGHINRHQNDNAAGKDFGIEPPAR